MASGHLPFTLLHLIFYFHFILLFHILNLEPEFSSEQTSVRIPSNSDSDLTTHIYTVELLVDTQFKYQLGLVLGTCQIDEDNLHEQSLAECVGFGEAISNVTLEPKP